MADVVCWQLGFPHGTRIDPLTARTPPSMPEGAPSPYSTNHYTYYYEYDPTMEDAVEPVESFWLSSVACGGPEARLVDCNIGPGFLNNNSGCRSRPHRIYVACRQFAVVEALEASTTPGAGLFLRLCTHSKYEQTLRAQVAAADRHECSRVASRAPVWSSS